MSVSLDRQYQILTEARNHQSKGWVAHTLWLSGRNDGGPVCAEGAILRSMTVREADNHSELFPDDSPIFMAIRERMNAACRKLLILTAAEILDEWLFVYINNEHGQKVILQVFDQAIQDLEAEMAQQTIESVPVNQPEEVNV